MNVDGYVLEIIKQIEEKGYAAYLAGTTVFMHTLGRPIKEYDVITSAPLFSFGKKEKREGNTLHIVEYEKEVHISFSLCRESYYKSCSLNIDTLLYHYRHGILDEMHALNDIDKKIIKIHNLNALKKNESDLFKAIFYTAAYDFNLDPYLEKYITATTFDFTKLEKKKIGKHLTKLLALPTPGKTILKYKNIFSNLFIVSEDGTKRLDYTKNDLSLRLFVLWQTSDIVLAEKFLREYGFSKIVKSRVLHILELQDIEFSLKHMKDIISKLSKEDIQILLSYKRASCLAFNQILEIKQIDALEAQMNSLYDNHWNIRIDNLKIKSSDLKQLGYKDIQIPKVLDYLLELVRNFQIDNKEDSLIEAAGALFKENE